MVVKAVLVFYFCHIVIFDQFITRMTGLAQFYELVEVVQRSRNIPSYANPKLGYFQR